MEKSIINVLVEWKCWSRFDLDWFESFKRNIYILSIHAVCQKDREMLIKYLYYLKNHIVKFWGIAVYEMKSGIFETVYKIPHVRWGACTNHVDKWGERGLLKCLHYLITAIKLKCLQRGRGKKYSKFCLRRLYTPLPTQYNIFWLI